MPVAPPSGRRMGCVRATPSSTFPRPAPVSSGVMEIVLPDTCLASVDEYDAFTIENNCQAYCDERCPTLPRGTMHGECTEREVTCAPGVTRTSAECICSG